MPSEWMDGLTMDEWANQSLPRSRERNQDMHGDGVLVVLTNWRRPQNLPQIIRAFKEQTVKPRQVVVMDNSPKPAATHEYLGEGREGYPLTALCDADDVWRARTNMGCPCKFPVALGLTGHRHVLLYDDDIIPGRRALEHLLKTAEGLQDRFATLGSMGRLFLLDRPVGQRYSGKSVPTRLPDRPVMTHITCQAHLIRSDLFHHAVAFRNSLLTLAASKSKEMYDEVLGLVQIHDDFLTSCGIQEATGHPSYVAPLETADPELCLIKDRLEGHSDATACWKRPTHFAERARMVDLVLKTGWRPVDLAEGTTSCGSPLVRIGDQYDEE